MDAPSINQVGSAGLGFVWGWLLVQLTATSQPSVRRWIVPLVATVALLGAALVLLDVRAMVTSAVATGVSAVVHVALIGRLRLQAGSHESGQIAGGGAR
jgi:hypothetical protein